MPAQRHSVTPHKLERPRSMRHTRIIVTQYGGPDALRVVEEECPEPKDGAAARLLWKIEKAYSLGIPKKNLAHGESQTEEEYAYGEKYTMFQPNGRSFWT